MSERKSLVNDVLTKLASFNKSNEERLRALQRGGGTSLYPTGYNPDTDTVGGILGSFKDEAHEIEAKLELLFRMEPEAELEDGVPEDHRWAY